MRRNRAAMLNATVLAIFMAATAYAQDHSHEGEVGRFYERWMRPDNRSMSCCNRQDCAVAMDVKRLNGQWMMQRLSDNEWVVVPDEKIENYAADSPRDSPDGRSHLCSSATMVFCAVLGNGM